MTVLRLVEGDIVNQRDASAIVNAANQILWLGGGVADVIKKKAGKLLQNECNLLLNSLRNDNFCDGVPVGSAAVTSAYNLSPVQRIIHAVGPDMKQGKAPGDKEKSELMSAYESVWKLSTFHGFNIVAVPFISTGLFKFDIESALRIALFSAIRCCPLQKVEEIRFVATKKMFPRFKAMMGNEVIHLNTATCNISLLNGSAPWLRSLKTICSDEAARCVEFNKDVMELDGRRDDVVQERGEDVVAEKILKLGREVSIRPVSWMMKFPAETAITFVDARDLSDVKVEMAKFAGEELKEEIVSMLRGSEDDSEWTSFHCQGHKLSDVYKNGIRVIALLRDPASKKDALDGFTSCLRRVLAEIGRAHEEKVVLLLPLDTLLLDIYRCALPLLVVIACIEHRQTFARAFVFLAQNDEVLTDGRTLTNSTGIVHIKSDGQFHSIFERIGKFVGRVRVKIVEHELQIRLKTPSLIFRSLLTSSQQPGQVLNISVVSEDVAADGRIVFMTNAIDFDEKLGDKCGEEYNVAIRDWIEANSYMRGDVKMMRVGHHLLLSSIEQCSPYKSDVTDTMTVLRLVEGDIVNQRDASAIVNAANQILWLGGGVADVIKKKAGKLLQNECNLLLNSLRNDNFCDGVPVGSAAVTSAYNLSPVQRIIHAVGPDMKQGKAPGDKEKSELMSAYESVWKLSTFHGFNIVAVPFISTGLFKFDIESALRIALFSAIRCCPLQKVEEIRFVATKKMFPRFKAMMGNEVIHLNTATCNISLLNGSAPWLRSLKTICSDEAARCVEFNKDVMELDGRRDDVVQERGEDVVAEKILKLGREVSIRPVSWMMKFPAETAITFVDARDLSDVKVEMAKFAGEELKEEIVSMLRGSEDDSEWTSFHCQGHKLSDVYKNGIRVIALLRDPASKKDALDGFTSCLRRVLAEIGRAHEEKVVLLLPLDTLLLDIYRCALPLLVVIACIEHRQTFARAFVFLAQNDEVLTDGRTLTNSTGIVHIKSDGQFHSIFERIGKFVGRVRVKIVEHELQIRLKTPSLIFRSLLTSSQQPGQVLNISVVSEDVAADGRIVFMTNAIDFDEKLGDKCGEEYNVAIRDWIEANSYMRGDVKMMRVGHHLLLSSIEQCSPYKKIGHLVLGVHTQLNATETHLSNEIGSICDLLNSCNTSDCSTLIVKAPIANYKAHQAPCVLLFAIAEWFKNADSEIKQIIIVSGSEKERDVFTSILGSLSFDLRKEDEEEITMKIAAVFPDVQCSLSDDLSEKMSFRFIKPLAKKKSLALISEAKSEQQKKRMANMEENEREIALKEKRMRSAQKQSVAEKKWFFNLSESKTEIDQKAINTKRRAIESVLRKINFSHFRALATIGDDLNREARDAREARPVKSVDIKEVVASVHRSFDFANACKAASTKYLSSEGAGLRRQSCMPVYHHEKVTDDEKIVREVGRHNYHVAPKRYEGPTVSLAEAIDATVQEWRGQSSAKDLKHQFAYEKADAPCDEAVMEGDPNLQFDFFDEQAEEFQQDIQKKINEISNAGLQAANLEVEELLADDEELREIGGLTIEATLAHVTRVHFCGAECTEFTADQARYLKKTIAKFLSAVKAQSFAWAVKLFEERTENDLPSALQIIQTHEKCYSGLRSILNRYHKMRAAMLTMEKACHALRTGKMDLLEAIRDSNLPKAIKDLVNSALHVLTDGSNKRHTEKAIKKKYGASIKRFKSRIMDTEHLYCKLCGRSTDNEHSQATTKHKIDNFLREEGGDVFCKKCLSQAPRSTGVIFSLDNGFGSAEVPDELKNLNWVEKLLIQQIRPVVHTVNLTDAGGRRTSMKAAKGALVLLPVPTEETLGHVARTLPSAVNMRIVVSCASMKNKMTIVDLDRVIAALKWLKANNEHYKNVNIDENFKFPKESIVGANGDEVDLVARTQKDKDETLLQHDDFTPKVVQDVGGDGKRMKGTAYEHYKLNKCPYRPISLDEKFPDAKSFPWLLPDGNFSFHEKRKGKGVTERKVAQYQMAYRDRRFATDSAFLAFSHSYLEAKTLLSSMGTRARQSKGKLSVDGILKSMQSMNEQLEVNMSSVAASLRGRAAYWLATKNDLEAHIANFGPPTWFITLNPSEQLWKDVLQVYQKIYPEETIDSNNIRDWVAKDPYHFSRVFQKRIRSIFDDVLLKKDGPLGNIVHYFHRIEYQQRGTQHLHGFLWDADAPGKDATDEERLKYVKKKVTARMPDPVKEPELYEIIKGTQMHWKRHSGTCQRKTRYGGKVITRCRFGFPRPAMAEAKWCKASEKLADVPGAVHKPYYLARKKGDEEYVNDYSPAVSLTWGSNTDLQYVSSHLSTIVSYMTYYAAKAETSKTGTPIQESLRSAVSNAEAFRVLQDMLRLRETGALEMIDLIMGHPMHSFDSSHIFINTNASDKRHRMLHSRDRLDEISEEGNGEWNAFKTNAYDNYYPLRDQKLEHLSLFTMLIRFTVQSAYEKQDEEVDKTTNSKNSEGFHRYKDPYAYQYKTKCKESPFHDHESIPKSTLFSISGLKTQWRRMNKPHVARIFWPHLEADNVPAREDYFRRLCMLFVPWRNEETMLTTSSLGESFETYETMWEKFVELKKNGTADEKIGLEDIEKFIARHTAQLSDKRDALKKMDDLRKLRADLGIDEDPEEGDLSVFDREVNDADHAENVKKMNKGQEEIFTTILTGIRAQVERRKRLNEMEKDTNLTREEKDAQLETIPEAPEIRLIVSGTAGTGKSFLINTLADQLVTEFGTRGAASTSPPVVIAAPTGIAAVQIKGCTCHSVFGIEVQKGSNAALLDLSPEKLKQLRILFRNTHLIIIDELSMISNVMLGKINCRLQEIFATHELFGGKNILMLGDLMQLPPVRASKIFEPMTDFEVAKMFGGGVLAQANFFDTFEYKELTENMRQRTDPAFGNAMLNTRIQSLTQEDIDALKSRLIPTATGDNRATMEEGAVYFVDQQTSDPSIMALFGTNREVDEFNKLVMEAKGMEVVTIEAEDTVSKRQRKESGLASSEKNKFARAFQRRIYNLADGPEEAARRGKYGSTRQKAAAFSAQEDDSNLTAGLAKKLKIAKNGRVMLRRNINHAKGLVNGATGTLIDIHTMDGSGEVTGLVVMFDGHKESTVIEKMSATFEVGMDDKITRRQFPLVTAFAATVHKCQGLTLQNVMISTANFFAHGMAFVAFSRVTSLKGLHLMDLNLQKITCDPRSLRKYNELRASVNLPPFAFPKSKMSDQQPDKGRKRTRKEQLPDSPSATSLISKRKPRTVKEAVVSAVETVKDAVIDAVGALPMKMSRVVWKATRVTKASINDTNNAFAKKAKLARSTSDVSAAKPKVNPKSNLIVTPDSAYLFHNETRTHCFANSVVNALLSLTPLVADLAAVPPGVNKVADLLVEASRRESDDVPARLRAEFPDFLVGQHDPADFIKEVIEKLDITRSDGTNIKDDFQMVIKYEALCKDGCRKEYDASFEQVVLSVARKDKKANKIEDLVKAMLVKSFHLSPTDHVSTCPRKEMLTMNLSIAQMPRYFILLPQMVNLEGFVRQWQEIPLMGVTANETKIYGKKYRMTGAVQYISQDEGISGHCKSWRKMPMGWSIANDDSLEYKSNLPSKSIGFRVIAFLAH